MTVTKPRAAGEDNPTARKPSAALLLLSAEDAAEPRAEVAAPAPEVAREIPCPPTLVTAVIACPPTLVTAVIA